MYFCSVKPKKLTTMYFDFTRKRVRESCDDVEFHNLTKTDLISYIVLDDPFLTPDDLFLFSYRELRDKYLSVCLRLFRNGDTNYHIYVDLCEVANYIDHD